jgi:superfamily II DNA or RNA helicase
MSKYSRQSNALSSDALRANETPAIKAKPYPHQVQALADIKKTLAKNDRATVVMASGTGKTLVALWAAEQRAAKAVLVLLPSLTLLQQTLREWKKHSNKPFSYLAVCSDPTVQLEDDDQFNLNEFQFRIDTDPAIVREFLELPTKTDLKVIFSTYHSSPIVGEGAHGLPSFDFCIFDEAHRTTSNKFSYALSDNNVRIRKRLFLTTTPRHIDIRHRDREGEFHIYSMDDENVYGPRAHTLTFGAAAKAGIICPYQVIISVIDKKTINDFARQNGITHVKEDPVAVRWMAKLIVLQRAIEELDAKKIISFHSGISTAKEFAKHSTHYFPGYKSSHISSKQNADERRDIIRTFAAAERALITNARILTEGIDVPAVDMVAFIDPRQSQVDIAQAAGRALRKAVGKTFGYIVVPLFVDANEDFSDDPDEDTEQLAIQREGFDTVVDVLNTMQEQDDDLLDIIREGKEDKGAGNPFNSQRLRKKLKVIGPFVDLDRLMNSIEIAIVDRIGSKWDEWFGVLQRYKAREGHCNVPSYHREGTFKLGQWVGAQRNKHAIMSVERIRRLNKIGFVWDALEARWEEAFSALEKFKAREGHCDVPGHHREGTFNLGSWISNQRTIRDAMSANRRRRLDAIGFIWDVVESRWEEKFAALMAFKSREGHCNVPEGHVESTFNLGIWVLNERSKHTTMSARRRQRLDEIGFVWDVLEAKWEESFIALQQFKTREGHYNVPRRDKGKFLPLGSWVAVQRFTKDTMSAERRQRLDGIGFTWNGNALEEWWEEGFAALTNFKEREDHCNVPRNHIEGTFKLGAWASEQRVNQNTMSAERKERLDGIGFVWNAREARWEEGFAALRQFKTREGHCNAPQHYREGTFPLGSWVSVQRQHKDTMPAERKKRLNAIGFVWRVRSKKLPNHFVHNFDFSSHIS